MRKVSIFGVYIFVLFRLVFSHLNSFRLHLAKLKSAAKDSNLRLSLSMGLCGAGSSLQFPTSASNSLPICRWYEIINNFLAPLICTNCAFYNKLCSQGENF